MIELRARFDGRVLIPEGPVDLPTDEVLELQVAEAEPSPATGDALSALLRAVRDHRHLTREDVAELENAIGEGKVPVRDQVRLARPG